MAFYIESGTGRQITDPSQADPSKFYIESGTGKQISGADLKGSAISSLTKNLPPDQQKAVQSVYDAIINGDEDYAERVKAAMKAGSEFSSPYFKAQTRLVSDALDRGLKAKDGDLSFNVNQYKNSLKDLKADISASKKNLSFQQSQELKQLERAYEDNILTTRQNMASTGFSSSSRRTRAEELQQTQYGEAVESTNRRFGYAMGQLDNQLMRAERDIPAQIARIQQLAQEGRVDALRQAESQIGSTALKGLGYQTLGGVGGSIPRAQAMDQLQFANGLIF